jgi:hypothetical protein
VPLLFCCAMRPAGASEACPHVSDRGHQRAPHERLVHPPRALLHAARARRLGRARLDAGDFEKQFNIGQGKAGVSATLYWQAPPSSAPRGGWLADRWMRAAERGRIYVSAIGMVLIVPAMFGVGNAGTPRPSPSRS